jgi:hypothetical protein
MKKSIRSVLLVFSLLAGAFGIAQAQSPDYLKVNVPFDFYAGNTHLPAGEYQVRRVNESEPSLLRMANAKGDFTLLSIMHTAGLATDDTRFVFQNSGETYVLTAVRTAHDTYNLHNKRAERMRNVAATEYSISGSN